mmetsp:Transcript_20995/g.58378  ORF Transcript_20995/g.58378 Transcript_20995/m.58378 type:complete len:238 (-) Transcript_20995:782-1495(-)
MPSLLLEKNFSHTIPFPFSQSFTVGTETALRFAQCPSFFLSHLYGLLFSWTNHRNFGMREAGGRDRIVINLVRTATNVFDCADSMCTGSMGKHHLAIGVTNAVQIRNDFIRIGAAQYLHLFVYVHKSTIRLDTTIFQSHVRSVWNASSGYHSGVDLDRFNVFFCLGIDHLDGHRLFTGDSWRYFGSKHTSSVINRPVSNQQAFGLFSNFSIKGWHEFIHCLDEGYLRSKGGVNIAEF